LGDISQSPLNDWALVGVFFGRGVVGGPRVHVQSRANEAKGKYNFTACRRDPKKKTNSTKRA